MTDTARDREHLDRLAAELPPFNPERSHAAYLQATETLQAALRDLAARRDQEQQKRTERKPA